MPLPSFSGDIEKNIIRHIKYRGTIRTGEIIVDNGDGTYDVKIAFSDVVYPSIETIHYEMVFAVGEIAVLAFEYGSKESPKIIGHGKKIAQTPVEVEVDYSGAAEEAIPNLISSSDVENKIYIHIGIGSGISNSFASPGSSIYGLAYDLVNLISCDVYTDIIYIHARVTSTILDSFGSPSGGPTGLTYDGANLISCDYLTRKIYVHVGITSSVSRYFASPDSSPYGLTYNGINLISSDYGNMIYIHVGITSSISDSFAGPDVHPSGLAFDGINLISSDGWVGKIFIHSGITSTITDSFDSPGGDPMGLTKSV